MCVCMYVCDMSIDEEEEGDLDMYFLSKMSWRSDASSTTSKSGGSGGLFVLSSDGKEWNERAI